MKHKKIAILILMNLTAFTAFSQPDKRSPKDKLIDYCACEIANIAVINYCILSTADRTKEIIGYKNIVSKDIYPCNWDDPIIKDSLLDKLTRASFSGLADSLNSVYESLKGKSSDANKILTTFSNSSYFNKNETVKNYLQSQFNLKKESIISLFNKPQRTKNEVIQTKPTKQPKPDKDESREKEVTDSTNNNLVAILQNSIKQESEKAAKNVKTLFFTFMTGLLGMFITLFAFINYQSKKFTKSNKNTNETTNRSDFFNSVIEAFKQFKNNTENQIIEINASIRTLQKEVLDIVPQEPTTQIDKKQNFVNESKVSESKPILTANPIHCYTPASDNEGRIDQRNITPSENPGKSCYKITLPEDNATSATFEFLNTGRSIGNAINNPEMFINPLCNTENSFHKDIQKIITTTPGKLKKDGNGWMLVSKAVIRYE